MWKLLLVFFIVSVLARRLSHKDALQPNQSPASILFATNPFAQNVIIQNQIELAQQELQRLNQNITYTSCPFKTPYFDGTNCITCKTYFNLNTKQCTNCPGNERFDKTRAKCIELVYLTNLYAKNLLLRNKTLAEEKTFQKRVKQINSKFVVKCPSHSPYAINNECVKCSDEFPLFDLQNYACAKCAEGQQYNQKEKQCLGGDNTAQPILAVVPLPSDSSDSNTVSQSTSPHGQPKFLISPETYGLILDNISLEDYTAQYKAYKNRPEGAILDCPVAQPYFNGHQCTACTVQNSKFRISDLQCTHCPDKMYYLYKEKKCVPN